MNDIEMVDNTYIRIIHKKQEQIEFIEEYRMCRVKNKRIEQKAEIKLKDFGLTVQKHSMFETSSF